MELKSRLLQIYVEDLPLNNNCCFYCLKTSVKCHVCEYAKKKGSQCVSNKSVFQEICHKKRELAIFIEENY